MRYQPEQFEAHWQNVWEEKGAFRTPQDLATLQKKPKYYVLDMFPYPSGSGLHVGHPEGYTATDVVARHKRAQGFHVMHPMGWDAFGLPAERAAERENIHPAIITKRNIDNFRRQIKRLGFSYDWQREVSTTDETYYRWTQWIFLKLYEKDLAYLAEVPVNWCPALGTVLSNEEVKDGVYVETGDPVERRNMRQWMLKITAYAERLLDDLDLLDWPESVKDMQRHWIGKSHGAHVYFAIAGYQGRLDVFTTRPDTLFGATYCVLAPEHPLVQNITTEAQREAVNTYIRETNSKSDLARTDLAKSKSGVFTGAYALNPVNDTPIPIWVADYVLMGYGTGAIMAVPSHDERDNEFAKQYDLPIVRVVDDLGFLEHSDFLDGLGVEEAKIKIIEWLEFNKQGKGTVQYRLRDWLFSRQRYWGEPFPIVLLDDGTHVALPESALPVTLPPIDAYKPTETGEPPLARAGDAWLMVELPDGRRGIRETNTMPQWAGSCWYYLRYLDPHNTKAAVARDLEQYWMPVDLYIGGVEHAVLHLLYSRFWHKVLFDCGVVSTREPFQKLFNQGMILAYSYRDARGKYYGPDEVIEKDGLWFTHAGEPVATQSEKMSKSKLNVVNPDDVIDRYGADAMRLYELFMGPLDQVKPWQMTGVEGVYRFLQRVWRLVVNELTGEIVVGAGLAPPLLEKLLHRTIKKVHEDTELLRFNTAISQMMIFVNEATAHTPLPRSILDVFLRLLSPYAPHIAEELWSRLGFEGLCCAQDAPKFITSMCEDDTITIVFQVNGKRRADLVVEKGLDKAALEQLALSDPKVIKHLEGKPPKRVIVVPGKLVNIVC